MLARSVALAQPAPAGPNPPREIYKAAEQAMAEGRYADAIAGYQRVYALSPQPALLFKLGSAHQKAGNCQEALAFFGRYLREGKPDASFAATTRQRIVECGGDPDQLANEPARDTGCGPAGVPCEGPPGPPADQPPPPPKPPEVVVEPPPASPPPPPPAPTTGKHQGAWLLVGGSIAMVTIGGVLAYSANASENDVQDLYVGLDGRPPRFDDRTRARYDDLIEEGERYELLSRVSFGIAGALAIGAAIAFVVGDDADEQAPRVAPVVSPRHTGIVVRF